MLHNNELTMAVATCSSTYVERERPGGNIDRTVGPVSHERKNALLFLTVTRHHPDALASRIKSTHPTRVERFAGHEHTSSRQPNGVAASHSSVARQVRETMHSTALLRLFLFAASCAHLAFGERPSEPQPERVGGQISPAWPWNPISVNIPIGRATASSIPLVILPIPVNGPGFAEASRASECNVPQSSALSDESDVGKHPEPPSRPPPAVSFGSTLSAEPELSVEPYPAFVTSNELDQTVRSPPLTSPFTTEQLVEMYRSKETADPSLPPALLSNHDISERLPFQPPDAATTEAGVYSASEAASSRLGHPPRPLFSRSMRLTGELTVPRADYTEPYTVWYDGDSGSARVQYHGGSASTYRTFASDGRVKYVEMHVDRSGEASVRRCARAESAASARADRAPPALPDLADFSFAGYVGRGDNDTVERWTHSATEIRGGENAARGERLTARREILLVRTSATPDSAVPLQYTVSLDSSVLGDDFDGYQHRYLDFALEQKERTFFEPRNEEMCDNVEKLNESDPIHYARLDPLKEFTLSGRDPRYAIVFKRFKAEHGRQYRDAREDAVRLATLVQSSRYSDSANRQGATFRLALNYLADRLPAELSLLMGAEALAGDADAAKPFPHSRRDVERAESRSPERFDWRPRGAVSPVQFQGEKCASCWAFAVSGSVEGALFVRTRRLVPLSPQCLVDCAHPFGGRGCGGTWPAHAYEYVRARGLPAADEYPAYSATVQRCGDERVPPVTRISSHVNVTSNSVAALKVAIKQHAPSVVLVDANHMSFVLYKEGVLYDDRCGKTLNKLKHAVLAVGWGARKGETHFVLKNSWSAAWGDRGYVRVQARSNSCGVLTQPSYPVLERKDVLREDLIRARPS
ncbi:unnamed protein product [Leptosia nina]|uniref:Uncharacterized protein n=1 Tax=Leptosia nina TaxID=320188 RepID=A0AAV1J2U8_9NEOP